MLQLRTHAEREREIVPTTAFQFNNRYKFASQPHKCTYLFFHMKTRLRQIKSNATDSIDEPNNILRFNACQLPLNQQQCHYMHRHTHTHIHMLRKAKARSLTGVHMLTFYQCTRFHSHVTIVWVSLVVSGGFCQCRCHFH